MAAEQEKKFSDEETLKLIKFMEENPQVLKGNSSTKQKLKEELKRDYLGKLKCWQVKLM